MQSPHDGSAKVEFASGWQLLPSQHSQMQIFVAPTGCSVLSSGDDRCSSVRQTKAAASSDANSGRRSAAFDRMREAETAAGEGVASIDVLLMLSTCTCAGRSERAAAARAADRMAAATEASGSTEAALTVRRVERIGWSRIG